MRFYKLFLGAFILFVSCQSPDKTEKGTDGNEKSESNKQISGYLLYDISYPEIDSTEGSLILKMLPTEMNMTYKDNRYKMSSEAALGMFETGYICDGDNRYMDYFLRLPSMKMASRFNEKGIAKIYPYIPEYKVNFTDSAKTIAGLPCIKAEIILLKTLDTLDAWHCPSFPLISPNWCNPYHQISGLLVDYEIYQYGIRAHLSVSKWTEEKVADDELRIQDDYKIVSNTTIQKKLKDMVFGF